MTQALEPSNIMPTAGPPAVGGQSAPNRMARMAAAVRVLATDLLEATDTRITKITAGSNGWLIEVEVFAPNPELTVSLRGGSKAILERSRYRFELDHEMQLASLEPVEG